MPAPVSATMRVEAWTQLTDEIDGVFHVAHSAELYCPSRNSKAYP